MFVDQMRRGATRGSASIVDQVGLYVLVDYESSIAMALQVLILKAVLIRIKL